MGRVQAKTVGHADGLLVEPLQFGIRHVLDLGGLMEQFAVEQFPAEPLGKFPATSPPPAPYSRVMVMTFIKRLPARYKKQAPPGIWFSWRGLNIHHVSPTKENLLKVGVISSGLHLCV